MNNKVGRIGFLQDYFNWLGGKAHLPLIKKWRRLWVLLFSAFLVVGSNNSRENPERIVTQFLSFAGWSLIYYAWQKRIADKKGMNVNEIPSNFLALIIILLVYVVLAYFLFRLYIKLPQ